MSNRGNSSDVGFFRFIGSFLFTGGLYFPYLAGGDWNWFAAGYDRGLYIVLTVAGWLFNSWVLSLLLPLFTHGDTGILPFVIAAGLVALAMVVGRLRNAE